MQAASRALGTCVSLLVFAAGGALCPAATYVVTVDDTVVMPGEKTELTAWVARGVSLAFKDDLRDAEVHFKVDGRTVARTRTDARGTARVSTDLSRTRGRKIEVTATYRGHRIAGSGVIYRWQRDRTTIAVDIDDCISHTSYSDLFVTHFDSNSRPFEQSREVLRRLAREYQILYISARPRFLTDKTRLWLDGADFPPGPYYHALGFDACLHQGTAKREILQTLRQRWPNLLIGIGDKGADDRCYGAVNMLTLLVNTPPFASFGDHCIVVRDWAGIGRFFDEHGQQLKDPGRLYTMMDRNHMNLKSAFTTPEQSLEQPKVIVVEDQEAIPAPSGSAISLAAPAKSDVQPCSANQ